MKCLMRSLEKLCPHNMLRIKKKFSRIILVVGIIFMGNLLKADDYPARPVQVIVPTTPGGTFDKIARLIQRDIQDNQRLSEKLVIQNLPGAGGLFGTDRIKDATPDGYTVGLWNPGLVTSKIMGNADYDHTAFDIIGATGFVGLGLGVRDDSPFQSIEELITHLQNEPESIKVATNLGLPVHFFPLMFAEAAKLEFRFVQVGGGSKRLASILGGHTDLGQFSILEFENYRSDDPDRLGIKPLVFFTEERSSKFPSVPTTKELGYDLVMVESAFWLAPKGMSEQTLHVFRDALRGAMEDPRLVSEFKSMGMSAEFIEAPEVNAFLNDMRQLCEQIPEDRLKVTDVVPINFPIAIFTVTGACCFLLIVQSRKRNPTPTPASERSSIRTWAFLVVSGLYIAALPFLGFSLATILCVALSGFVLCGFRLRRPDIVGVATMTLALGVGINVLFRTVFKINLP